MSKIFRTRGFVIDRYMKPTTATIEVDTDKQTVEFRAADYTVTASLDKVKELISEYAVIGTTMLKEDKDNHTLIRYTKGIHGMPEKHVTMSLSHLDRGGVDEYMITADASEFDRYMRGKMYEKPRT